MVKRKSRNSRNKQIIKRLRNNKSKRRTSMNKRRNNKSKRRTSMNKRRNNISKRRKSMNKRRNKVLMGGAAAADRRDASAEMKERAWALAEADEAADVKAARERRLEKLEIPVEVSDMITALTSESNLGRPNIHQLSAEAKGMGNLKEALESMETDVPDEGGSESEGSPLIVSHHETKSLHNFIRLKVMSNHWIDWNPVESEKPANLMAEEESLPEVVKMCMNLDDIPAGDVVENIKADINRIEGRTGFESKFAEFVKMSRNKVKVS